VGIASEGIVENIDLPVDEGARVGGSYRYIIVGGGWGEKGELLS